MLPPPLPPRRELLVMWMMQPPCCQQRAVWRQLELGLETWMPREPPGPTPPWRMPVPRNMDLPPGPPSPLKSAGRGAFSPKIDSFLKFDDASASVCTTSIYMSQSRCHGRRNRPRLQEHGFVARVLQPASEARCNPASFCIGWPTGSAVYCAADGQYRPPLILCYIACYLG
jgi:hypothetical protein